MTKTQFFKQVKALIIERFEKKEAAFVCSYVEYYYQDLSDEDVSDRELEDLYGAAIAHLNLAKNRVENAYSVHVYNPDYEAHGWQSTHTVVEVVTADMPFLVNSLTMNLNEMGLTCHLVVHPVIPIDRDKKGVLKGLDKTKSPQLESFIRIEIDRQTAKSGAIEKVSERVERVLACNIASVDDWEINVKKLQNAKKTLKAVSAKIKGEDIAESIHFLDWLEKDNFLFLGYREYELVQTKKSEAFKIIEGTGSGILRDELAIIPDLGEIPISSEKCVFMSEACPLVVTKATTKSILHRPAYMDYVGVKKFNNKGQVIGEYRFLGLYTSTAYHAPIEEVPLIRKKVEQLFAKSAFKKNSHNAKSLMNVMEGLPRDELFHSSDEQLLELALGVLKLKERQRIKVFARGDGYGQFVSVLVYVPRDHYNTNVRKKMEGVLSKRLNADNIDFNVQFSDSIFARIHFIIHTPNGWDGDIDVAEIENEITELLKDWKDELRTALTHQLGEVEGKDLYNSYGDGFTESYKENYPARSAVIDLLKIEKLKNAPNTSIEMSLYQPLESQGNGLQFKLINKGNPAPLSQTLPVLENMGVTVFDEHPFEITDVASNTCYWIHDFGLVYGDELPSVEKIKTNFQDVFEKVWMGHVENDGFNQLALKAELDWKKIMLLRAYYLYLRQAGAAYSQEYVEQTLANNPVITAQIVELFELKFDPGVKGKDKKLAKQESLIVSEIEKVVSLDEDRILRRYLNLIQSTLRTSYFQNKVDKEGVPYVAFKLNPELITDLPSPRPKFEIFVYSPRVEGVHLRGGPVARGGLRWSDRKEDFRTEVLGLMKAQMSKNAVIVPTGAKGGFIVKRSLDGLSRDEFMEEGIACYSIFIGALLDITDNLKSEKVIPPVDVVRYDGDDPYLVVAADKGTATFSDIANGIAIEHGFWLGDAFASGGSVGYDHKKMGITAKGAWESVKRHFREMGIDTQTTPFNVVGIGDMGGDVFGNGMLLSEKICLVGAFNHLHIFLDPTPNTDKSFKERERLFNLPRSSWADFETKLISKGGGVYSRTEKSITITPQVQEILDIKAKTLTPNELIQAMLKAPVDLLWNGGIGTYVKASSETHAEVGDKANDSLRINGGELRCKVMGEGGNLGFTQLGRIEYAAHGRINTDAIDNAAGVDCSDHEVNIKILVNKLVEQGDMTGKQRDVLLAKMTDEVGDLVLRNNYLQTQAISMVEQQAPAMLEVHSRLIELLGQEGRLDRNVEYLPNNEEIEERKAKGLGLYRPELSVVFAYSKLLLKDLVAGSPILRDKGFKKDVLDYFPSNLRTKFLKEIDDHRLRDDIIVNQLVNSMVNRLGPSFAFRMRDETGAGADEVVKAYKIACDIFDTNSIWNQIEALDNNVLPDVQNRMLMEVRQLIERTMYWLHSNRSADGSIADVVNEFSGSLDNISEQILNFVSGSQRESIENKVSTYQDAGVGEPLAMKLGCLELEFSGLDIIAVQSQTKQTIGDVMPVFFAINDELKLDWLHAAINRLPRKNYWQSLARSALRDDLHAENRALLTSLFLQAGKGATTDQRIGKWCESNRVAIDRYLHLISVIQAENEMEIEQLSVILKEVHGVVEKSKLKQ
jgi:glutamate dehydrogenase